MILVTIGMLGGTYRLFRAAPTYEMPFLVFVLLLLPLGIILLILGVRKSRRSKKKAIEKGLEIEILKEGETKKNPGVATVLFSFSVVSGNFIMDRY